ncbi:hypothetical protein ACP70R_031201 [Stipagrostis hirtigluma subsp. patula]
MAGRGRRFAAGGAPARRCSLERFLEATTPVVASHCPSKRRTTATTAKMQSATQLAIMSTTRAVPARMRVQSRRPARAPAAARFQATTTTYTNSSSSSSSNPSLPTSVNRWHTDFHPRHEISGADDAEKLRPVPCHLDLRRMFVRGLKAAPSLEEQTLDQIISALAKHDLDSGIIWLPMNHELFATISGVSHNHGAGRCPSRDGGVQDEGNVVVSGVAPPTTAAGASLAQADGAWLRLRRADQGPPGSPPLLGGFARIQKVVVIGGAQHSSVT